MRSVASSYADEQLSGIQSRAVANNENRDGPIDFAKCYETFSDNVNAKIEGSVVDSNTCLTKSEAARTKLHEDPEQKDLLEAKIVLLTAKFDVCSDKEVNEYFKCHDDNVSI